MSAERIELPVDAVLGDWRAALAPPRVLEACREQLQRVDEAQRRSWRCCRMVGAAYHPGRYVRVAYVLLADPDVPAHRRWPEGQIVYLHGPARTPISRRGAAVTIDNREFEAYVFPNDRRLRGLRRFAGKQDAVATWQRWIDESAGDFRIDADSLQRLLVRYVPERKWIVRLRVDGKAGQKRRIAVRAASEEACTVLQRRHEALSGADLPFRVPALVGADLEQGLLAVEWIRGDTLLETLRNEPVDAVMSRVANILSAFHGTRIAGVEPHLPADVLRRADEAVADLAAARPDLAQRLGVLHGEFRAALQECALVEPVTLHNDFHWNQLSIKKERFALLDLERMGLGDPLIDVANFATQIRMLADRRDQSVERSVADVWADQFLEQWSRSAGKALDDRRLVIYGVLSRLELARGMLRHLRPHWCELAERCLAAAESELSGLPREVSNP